jgi:hypothetical protein
MKGKTVKQIYEEMLSAKRNDEPFDINELYFAQKDVSVLISHLLDAVMQLSNADFQISLDDGTILRMNNELRKKFKADYDKVIEQKINAAFIGYADMELRNVLEIKKRFIESFPELDINLEKVKR